MLSLLHFSSASMIDGAGQTISFVIDHRLSLHPLQLSPSILPKNKQPSQPELKNKVKVKWSLSEARLMLEHLLAELQR